MFDYEIAKHPHFNNACRAFANKQNLVDVASRKHRYDRLN